MRYLQYAGMVIIFALGNICMAQFEVNGDVEGRWTIEDSPYIVTGDITVRNDDELIIASLASAHLNIRNRPQGTTM